MFLTMFLGACQPAISEVEPQLTTTDTRFQESSTPSVPNCGKKELMTKLLSEAFQETPLLYGIAGDGSIITMYAGSNATWTVTRTVNNTTCVIMAGTDLEVIKIDAGRTI
tara:strand:- start:716 stop:1045 length:330 start_codon:yes stop_codon:yes gene_type:complete